ncbi:MAG TPA: DUF58 domain-containing protein [Candidatus Limnocylindrales bacterium]|jgi:uncharacterized protein (DUF58 family)
MLRRLPVIIVSGALLVAAFSTGAPFLFFLVYLGILVIGGAYVVTRFGLADLEAGYALDRVTAAVGETLRVTYTIRNAGRLPKLWLELHNPTTLPVPLPGRALALGPHAERAWAARVPLSARGHFRVDPLVIRTGDPFGLFEASATVGSGTAVTVYPRVEQLPRWRLPASTLEGSSSMPERTLQTTPLVTSVRPYAPGDAYNRIHWKSTARQGDLQVKEFDLEQTADLWIVLDLDRHVQAGVGDESTVESAVRVAASLAASALFENRAVGMTVAAQRLTTLPADRGGRQHQKIMSLLAAVGADGSSPLTETLLAAMPRIRRGMTAIVVTPSIDRGWVRPLGTLRGRGVSAAVCLLDRGAYDAWGRRASGRPPLPDDDLEEQDRAMRAMRHALAEHDIATYPIVPATGLGELLVARGAAGAGIRG